MIPYYHAYNTRTSPIILLLIGAITGTSVLVVWVELPSSWPYPKGSIDTCFTNEDSGMMKCSPGACLITVYTIIIFE